MVDWFNTIARSHALSTEAIADLQERGFAIISGPLSSAHMDAFRRAYAAVETSAAGDDLRIGSTTTRVSDCVNRGADFDDLYVFPPLLEACCRVIGKPFKLSSFHARTLRPHATTDVQKRHATPARTGQTARTLS